MQNASTGKELNFRIARREKRDAGTTWLCFRTRRSAPDEANERLVVLSYVGRDGEQERTVIT
jgi:hypothetical protein